MNYLLRRVFFVLLTLVYAANAAAQPYPNRPIEIIVAFSPGGGTDTLARLIANKLSDTLKQPVIVNNRPGGATTIAMDALMGARPDGYTLLLTTPDFTVVPSLMKVRFDPVTDFTPIAIVAKNPLLLAAHPDLPFNNLTELMAYAKEHPAQLNYGSAGVGSGGHLGMELLKSMADINITHAPYKGNGPAINDLLAGHIQLVMASPPSLAAHVKAGKLKLLASTGTERLNSWPQVPTVSEQGLPQFSAVNWFGVLAPKGTSAAIVSKLNEALRSVMGTPEMHQQLASLDADLTVSSPDEFLSLIKQEVPKWAAVVQATGEKLD